MNELLTVIAVWISVNFGLDIPREHPRVEFLAAPKIVEVWHANFSEDSIASGSDMHQIRPESMAREIHAFYYDQGMVIFLKEGWTVSSTSDVSVLVHEMVHHLQNSADLEYICPLAREELAYRAQASWLEMHGRSLETEFGLDPFTILVQTQCMY